MINHFFFVSIAIILLNCHTLIYAQSNDWRAQIRLMVEEGLDEGEIEAIYEDLLAIENNPFNLNDVTLPELERFPLLNDDVAKSIFSFLEKNRPVYTVYELRNVPYLDYNTLELILPFFYVGEVSKNKESLKKSIRRGKNEMQFRLDKVLNQRAGFHNYSDSILESYPNRKYQGADFYNSLKYSFTYRDKVQVGFVAEKDAGEPFFSKNNKKGYDHYGFNIVLRDLGKLSTLAIGDYRLSLGQGLILNNSSLLTKSWGSINIIQSTQQPRRHFSTGESGFFRGAALSWNFANVSVTTFYSNKKTDANLSPDMNITSFKTDGLHRTLLEIEKKHNAKEELFGANLNYRINDLQIGVSALHHTYDKFYNPLWQSYNHYYLRDISNFNASMDYSYRWQNLEIAGEIAVAKNRSVANIHMLQYKPSGLFMLSTLYRHYPISYNAMHARAFGEGSRVQNESGLYSGISWLPFAKTSVTAYIDIFKFPWLRYQVDKPSKGVDVYAVLNYKLNRNSDIALRYKYKQKEKNAFYPNPKSKTVLPYHTQKTRLRYNIDTKSGWNFKSTIDLVSFQQKHFDRKNGWMISQHVGYKKPNKFNNNIYLAFFDAESYDVRLYSYESNILNTFYMPSFYDRGLRLALSHRYYFSKKLQFSVKIGHTHYFNRESIGTGTEKIEGNSRTDLFTYLRWQF